MRANPLQHAAMQVTRQRPQTPSLGFEPEPWMDGALCTQTDPEMFYPEKGGATREAKRICASCDVRSECLLYALNNAERFGVWGGLSERERRRLQAPAQRRKPGQHSDLLTKPCGTAAAYRRHLRHGENPCSACAAAQRLAWAERRARHGAA